jgi:chromosome segregation ATPase
MESFRKAELEREDNLIKWKAASDKTVILEKDISRLEDARKSLEAKYDSRDKELQKVEAEAQKLKKDILSLDREYAAVSETLLAAKMSETVMKDQLANSQKLLREAEARLRSETGKYEEQMSSLGTQNNLLQDALTKAKSDLQLLTNSLKIEQAEKYKYYEESKLQSARNNELQRQTEAVHLKVRAADEENQLLAGRLKDVQSQTDTLRKENTNLKAQVLSSDALVTQLKEQMESGVKRSSEREASFSSRIAELTGLLKERTGEKEKIQAEKNKADESYVKLDKEYQAVVESAKISTGDLSALKQVNADLQSKLAKSEGLKGKAEKDLIEVSEALKVSRESERKIHEQLTGAQKSYAETEARLKGQLAKNEEQIIVLGNTAKKLSVERVSQDKQIKEMSEQLDVLAAENKNQKNQLGGNVSQIAGLNDMVRKLSSEKESQDRQLRDLNEQLVLLTKENKSQKEQLSKSEKDIRARTDELASLQKGLNEEMAKSKEDKVKYDDARVRYEEQINKLKSDGTALEGANKKLFQQVETQGKQLRDKDESLMTLSRDSRDYKERVGSLEQQLSKIEGESRVKITELSDKLRSETSRHDDTASRLRFASDKVSSLEKDIKRYEETNKSLMAKYDAIDKDFRASEIERQKVSTDLKSANDRIGLLQKDQGYLDSSLKAAVSERDKAQEDKNKNEMNLAGVTKEANLLREKNDQLLKDSAALQSKIKTQEYEFNTALKKERDAYLVAFNELNSAKEAARGSQWQLSELQTKNVTLDKTVASLQTQLKSQESDMQATIKQERDMRNSYMAKLEEAEGRVNNYMKVEIDLRQKNSTIEKELAAWKVTVDDKIAEAMKQKETDYINRLREANERVKIMEETLTKERSNFYYNLASYATRSQLFEEALNYYAKSLLQNPKDAATYYNMGVLYDEHLDNPSKAIFSYSKYLELAPADAADREKVKKWINSLEKRLGGSKSGLIKKD